MKDSETMKNVFISASKYRELAEAEGARKALEALARDIGSQGEISTVHTPEWSVGRGLLAARFEDVHVVIENSGSGGTLRGLGNDEEEAIANFLENLLAPEDNIPDFHDRAKARLGVGNILDYSTIVKVEP